MYNLTIRERGNGIRVFKGVCWLDVLHELDTRERNNTLSSFECEYINEVKK